jgi:hypothetical protein
MNRHISIASVLASTIVVGALGCMSNSPPATPSSPPAAPRMWVGEVAGTDARVAVVATEHKARVYFCGGDSSFATSSKWVVAPIEDSGSMAASSASWRIEGHADASGVRGWVDRGDGVRRTFEAAPVQPGTIAGLYETTAACGRVGVIVSQPTADATPVVQGACIGAPTDGNPPATILQVNPIGPLARDADGSIAVQPVGQSEPAQVRPAAPPSN